jgi:hypothetical protein
MVKFSGCSFRTNSVIVGETSKTKEDSMPLIEDFNWQIGQVGEYLLKC